MSNKINSLENTTEKGWDIYDALREPRTEYEANPPEDLGYEQACVPLSATLSNSLHGVVRHIENEYDMTSKSQSAQRLLRVGLQEIESPQYTDSEEADLSRLKAYRDVVFKFVPSIGETKFGYSALRQQQPLSVDFGWGSVNREDSFSIFWCQKEKCKTYKDYLRVPYSDIFQWGLVNATVVLGEEGLIDPSEADKAQSIQQSIAGCVEDRIQFTRDVAKQSISRAYKEGDSEKVAEYCRRNVPDLWREFKETTYANHQSLEEDEFLYPVGL